MIIESIRPFLAVLVPALTIIFLPFLSDAKGNRLLVWSMVLDFLIVASMYPAISDGNTIHCTLNTGLNVQLAFMADALSMLAGLIAIFMWMLASVFSVKYMAHEHAQCRYNVFSLLSLTGMMGVVFTKNLFSLYLFFEMLSIASYVMVIHEESPDAAEAGLKYIFMGVCGGLILLFAIISTYAITGTGDLVEIAKISGRFAGNPMVAIIFLCFIVGFGVKAGLFPVHIWLPDAHPVAPSPASALLSGVMIKAGAYGIIRTVYTIMGTGVLRGQTVTSILLIFAVINIFLGSAVAIKQTELKRMLAYSSISQMGYIILGVALMSPKALTGGVVHIFNHAIIKGTLFLCAGAFIAQTGLRQLVDLKGIGKRMPVTTACFTLAALSMIGFPPFNGFISKWFLALGALEATQIGTQPNWVGTGAVLLLMLSSLMNLIYYGPVIYGAWFGKVNTAAGYPVNSHNNDHAHNQSSAHGQGNMQSHIKHPLPAGNDDPGLWMKIPLIILGACIVFFGIFPQLPIGLAQQASQLLFH
ncbi:MAG: monovalent cation/H+ antiporter subunit D family protein [Candidatus Schekmanbacteria bacterium]|nr:monovalent cation/H+ antiporter subunit D family protein [Candidatus Schekmanbacteria bacterium]